MFPPRFVFFEFINFILHLTFYSVISWLVFSVFVLTGQGDHTGKPDCQPHDPEPEGNRGAGDRSRPHESEK